MPTPACVPTSFTFARLYATDTRICSKRPTRKHAKLAANGHELVAILDEVFGAQPMAHWYDALSGFTFAPVRGPQEVINDPQLKANDIVVPLEGAGGKLTSTISSPIQVHGVAKVPARRAPDLGEHNEEILRELGFGAKDIDALRASGAVRKAKERAA